ncbi:hypothetical protein KJ627_01270 [Patescibacteria group bacterium]|nr:hypothetical protein [Patescibacteria group bacterium]MBU2233472.1 hypothetical protein [Patescibacteria group bacterium]
MTKKLKYSLVIVFLSMTLVLIPVMTNFKAVNQVMADSWWDTVNQGGFKDVNQAYGNNTPTDIRVIIANIIKIILGLLGIIFLVLIIYAGFNWMTAAGDEEKVTKATDTLRRAIIGLIIIIAAFAIATLVLNSLTSSTAPRLKQEETHFIG